VPAAVATAHSYSERKREREREREHKVTEKFQSQDLLYHIGPTST